MKIQIFSLIMFVAAVGCQSTKFSRSGAGNNNTKNTTGINGNDGSNSGNPSDPSNPNNPNNPSNPNNPGGGVIGLPGNPFVITPGSNPFWEPINTNPFYKSFGGSSEVWHIGDTSPVMWSGSTCRVKLDWKLVVPGVKFSFYFYVKNDNTNVKITMKYCGVDYQGSVAKVLGPGGINDVKDSRPLELTSDWGIFTTYQRTAFATSLKLNRGWHRVQTATIRRDLGDGRLDWDNYLVGRVNLDPDGPVELGEVKEE